MNDRRPAFNLIDLLAIEYANTPEDPKSPFTRAERALCSLLDKRGIYAPGVSSALPEQPATGKAKEYQHHDPEELEQHDLAGLGLTR